MTEPSTSCDFPRTLRRVVGIGSLAVAALCQAGVVLADDSQGNQYAFGAGVERMPAWIGSTNHRDQPIPYFDIELPGIGEISTSDGLLLDFIDDSKLHGGLYANYVWGRTHKGLGSRLGGIIDSLSPRIQTGGYLDYQLTKQFSYGANLSHDTDGAGAYLKLYSEYDLPNIGYIEHSLQLQWQAMNGGAMQRFFGINSEQAAQLGTPTWRPGLGGELAGLEYDAFIPTSQRTGFALALGYTRLLGQAGASPLVRQFGSRNQLDETLAFVYHF